MDNYETAKKYARDKLKSAFILVAGAGALCCISEYRQAVRPTDTATLVVVQPQVQEAVQEERKTLETAVDSKEAVKPVSEVDGKTVAEFLEVLKTDKEKLEKFERPESVLEKIRQPEVKEVKAPASVQVFEEGKIEIYDSDKGVVAVVDEKKPVENAAKKAADDAAEQLQSEARMRQEEAEKAAAGVREKEQKAAELAAQEAESSGAVNMLPAALVSGGAESGQQASVEAAAELEQNEAAQEAEKSSSESENGGAAGHSEQGAVRLLPPSEVKVIGESAMDVMRSQAETASGEVVNVVTHNAEQAAEKVVLKAENPMPAPVAPGDPTPMLKVVDGEIVSVGGKGESDKISEEIKEPVDNTSKNEDAQTGKEAETGAVNMLEGLIPAVNR